MGSYAGKVRNNMKDIPIWFHTAQNAFRLVNIVCVEWIYDDFGKVSGCVVHTVISGWRYILQREAAQRLWAVITEEGEGS